MEKVNYNFSKIGGGDTLSVSEPLTLCKKGRRLCYVA